MYIQRKLSVLHQKVFLLRLHPILKLLIIKYYQIANPPQQSTFLLSNFTSINYKSGRCKRLDILDELLQGQGSDLV